MQIVDKAHTPPSIRDIKILIGEQETENTNDAVTAIATSISSLTAIIMEKHNNTLTPFLTNPITEGTPTNKNVPDSEKEIMLGMLVVLYSLNSATIGFRDHNYI